VYVLYGKPFFIIYYYFYFFIYFIFTRDSRMLRASWPVCPCVCHTLQPYQNGASYSGVGKGGVRGPGPRTSKQNIGTCLSCTKFANLVSLFLEKIIQIVTTISHLLRLKCAKFDFGWSYAPDPARGSHSASPDLLARF